jgi:hypothetical protein
VTARRRLAPALARHRRRPLALVAVATLTLTAAYATVATITASFHTAVADSVVAEQAGRSHSLLVVNAAAGLPAVERAAGLSPVRDTAGALQAGGGEFPVTTRVTRDAGLPVGVLVEGRYQRSPEEVTVTRAVARDLGVRIGSTVRVTVGDAAPADRAVVGLTVDPADRTAATVVTLDPRLAPADATAWLDDRDTFARPELRDALAERSVTGRTTRLLAADRAAREKVPGLDYAAPALAGLMVAVLLGLLAALRSTAGRDVAALEGAGLPRRSGWWLVARLAAAALVVGTAAGGAAGPAVVALARGPVSGRLGQDWQRTTVPVPALLGLAATLVLAAGLLVAAVAAAGRWRRRPAATTALRRWRRRPGETGGAAAALKRGSLAALTAAAGLYVLSAVQVLPVGASTAAGLLTALCAPAALVRLVGRGGPPATAAVVRRLGAEVVVLATAVSLVAWTTAWYAARETHNAAASDRLSSPYQPSGSLLVLEVPERAAATLVEDYPGRSVRAFDLPDESASQLRVTGTALLGCLGRSPGADVNQLPQDCYPQLTAAPVNRVLLAPAGEAEVRADPGLLADGRVGLLRFQTGTATVTELADTAARPDPQLGGNMPGLVVPAGSALATRLALRPSGGRLVAFLDFADLPGGERARFRAAVSRVAPAAQVAEAGGGSNELARSVAAAVAVGGLALTCLVLSLGGLAVVSAQRRLRRVLSEMGARPDRRRAITLRWILVPAGGLLAGAGAALLSAWTSGIHDGHRDFGWTWSLPAAGGLLVCAALARQFSAVPARGAE